MTNETELDIPETMEIEDLDMFVRVLLQWHTNKVRILEQIAQIPEGSEMQVGEDVAVTLTGDMLTGFKAGIELSLIELGKLPFVAEVEADESAQ